MKHISYWAKAHQTQAIALIIFIKILLPATAIFYGLYLRNEGIALPFFPAYIAFGVLVAAALFYPERKKSDYSKQFHIRKTFDFLLVISAFTCSMLTVNRPGMVLEKYAFAASIINPPSKIAFNQIIAKLEANPKAELTKAEKKILRKNIKPQFKQYVTQKLNGQNEEAKRTWLTILVILGATGLSLLVASLACSLSCNGSDALAILVAVGGTFLIVYGTIKLIKRIYRKNQKEADGVVPPAPSS